MSAKPLNRANPSAEPPGKAVAPADPGQRPHVRDFAQLDDEEFVEAAYRAVLGRDSDPGGAAHYRGLLAQGTSQAEILTCLVDSPEGRAAGSRVAGLTWARRWAKFGRLPVLGRLLAIGRRLSPLTGLRSDLRAVMRRLARMTARVAALELEAQQRDSEAQQRHSEAQQRDSEARYRLESMRTVLLQALATRADSGALAALQAALHDLSARVTALRQLEQSKADQAALDHLRDELQTLLYRGIDDVDRTFRMLLDTKANTDAVTEVGAALDHRLHGMRQRLEQQVQAVDARKADASAIDAARNEMLATLHSIEALGTTFRALLDGKAATTEVAEVGAALDQRLHSMQQDLERQVEALDARKADAGAIEMARNEMLEALRTALTGLTGSVGAVAATRVDRATVNALLAENSKTLQAQFQDSVRELRTSIEELSAR